jgi:subtilisin family serine protease
MRTLTRTLIAAPVAMVMAALTAPPAPAQLSEPPAPIQTYPGDPGTLGDPVSWRTPEFNRDVGLVSIGAEYAYAAGYAGAGMSIGVVDSGVFAGHMREHGSLATMPEGRVLYTGGYLFRVSYQNNSVTLTVMSAIPPGR